MAAIVTAIYKTTPAGVFAVCPFLLCCSLVCPIRTPDGRTIPPLPDAGCLSVRGPARGIFTHTGEFFRDDENLAHYAPRMCGRDAGASCGGAAPARCRVCAGDGRKTACGQLMAHVSPGPASPA